MRISDWSSDVCSSDLSVADAEDVVQDAFLRWLAVERDAVREPEAFLRRIVTRLCLDELKSARSRRAAYVGSWMPEPPMEAGEDTIDDDLTLPLVLALERVSPIDDRQSVVKGRGLSIKVE